MRIEFQFVIITVMLPKEVNIAVAYRENQAEVVELGQRH